VYPRFPWDTGLDATQGIPGLLHGGSSPVGLPFDALSMDVDRLAEEAATDPAGILTATSSWTNLNTFSSRGGKLAFFGVGDLVSALDTVELRAAGASQRRRGAGGGSGVPGAGVGHCRGGRPRSTPSVADGGGGGEGTPPDAVTARRAFPGRSRPLCAYPKHAHYKGQGDVQDAQSFECR
jgi:feruloyl esterase